MGKNLTGSGELTIHQKIRADAMGMPYDEFKQHIVNRLLEERGGIPPKTRRLEKQKKNNVEAYYPVLVVGAGPSHENNFDRIKKFQGKVIVLDVNFNECVNQGIIPDFLITLESGKNNVIIDMFHDRHLKACEGKTTAIGSYITRKDIYSYLGQYMPYVKWTFPEEPRVSNCGLFALNFAYNELKADKIFLLGFEHQGGRYPPHIYQVWQTDFWYFVKQWPKETIVNCSDGGALYYDDYIIDTTLDKVKIEPRDNRTS